MKKLFILISLALILVSCKEEPVIVSPEKPYTVAIKKERSYYQAQRIAAHLKEMGIDAYIVENGADKNKWFYVATGAFETMTEADFYKQSLLNEKKIKADTVFSYGDFPEEERNILQSGHRVVEEQQRINAQPPDVPRSVMLTIEKVPQTNAFYIGKMGLVNFESGRYGSLSLGLDLPRGISLSYLGTHGQAFSEVILTDNVFGDRVTFDVIKLKDSEDAGYIASEMADKILATDNYEIEEKDPFSVNAYTPLNGYRVTLKTKSTKKAEGKIRTYYILADNQGNFIYLSQSVEKDDDTLMKLMAQIGKGGGLSSYDEFWNSFYLMPTDMGGDMFIAYSTSRVGWQYVKDKGYEKWAKLCLGLWDYSMYFYAKGKGVWKYSVRDLLTPSKNQYVYSLFSKNRAADAYTNICGAKAIKVSDFYGTPIEVSFIKNRYLIYINPMSGSFSFRDMTNRAEKFQFVCREHGAP